MVQEPNSRAGLYFMSQVNFNLGNMDQARAFAGDLERNYPDYLPAKLMQVQISLAAGDTKAALRLASELIDRINQTAPDRQSSPQMLAEIRAKAYLARGSAELDQGNTVAARQDFIMARDAGSRETFPTSVSPQFRWLKRKTMRRPLSTRMHCRSTVRTSTR